MKKIYSFKILTASVKHCPLEAAVVQARVFVLNPEIMMIIIILAFKNIAIYLTKYIMH